MVVVRPRYFTRAAQVEAHAERQGQRQVDTEASGPHASVGFARVCVARVVGREILIRECGLGLWAWEGDRLLALLTWP